MLQAVVHGDLGDKVRPRRDEVVSILTVGGATIITLNQALTVGAHFCVTKADRPAADPKLKQLQGAGLCIVSPSFVVEWVAHPWSSPAKVYILPLSNCFSSSLCSPLMTGCISRKGSLTENLVLTGGYTPAY